MSDEPIHACAEQIEALLKSQNATLTMGGEPTFVPNMPKGDEWNNGAMGPEKLGYARRLTAQLLKSTFKGGLVMQVFGKLYPGEPLPRWNLLTLQRKVGDKLWPAPDRFLLDDTEGSNADREALRLMKAIVRVIEPSTDPMPAIEQDRKKATGWVLPLDFKLGVWETSRWPFSKKKPLKLVPGDSPIGLRLPLAELPENALRRALTIEVRRGALEIFIPPLEWDGFELLIAMIEKIAAKHDVKDLVICGYAPYETKGATTGLGLAADPGVLEVNLPPAETWADYAKTFSKIAKAANRVGLYLTKRSLNGVIRGTGGGSHLAFGGPSPDDNIFFEQPQLLSSIMRYWQHHPALSYAFTGQYVGAGCQAPRVDEGPMHSLYELEAACEGLEKFDQLPTREMLDQLFRNLLTDASGNTHRAEICLDKFWNFSSPTGKIGIVELRAFETLPSPESMTHVALFIRAIIAMLAKKPFKKKLKRFRATLHDQYLLPSVLEADFAEVCADLKTAGIDFDPTWLQSALDFRCPVLGELKVPGGKLTVRQALDPWPLMAEESLGAATVRVVDNSTDRVEFSLCDPKLSAMGQLVVNGVALPWQEINGKAVVGLRYKCASAYPALHPHVDIQSPLHIQWISKGEVTAVEYFYWNPEGPLYDGLPDSDAEATKRREIRWQPVSKADPYPDPRPAKITPESKWTIDLRRD